MKAIEFNTYGDINAMKLVDKPKAEPGAKQVLVKVKYASLNAMEWHIFRGLWMVRLKIGLFKPSKRYSVQGADLSGEVIAVGEQVSQFKPGDHVFGDIFMGSYAEFALANENQLALKPENITHQQAAAIPVAGMTALKGIRDIAKVKSGDHILINGASGGVGTFAVQLAKSTGAKVTAVCSKKNHEAIKALGANATIDYTTTDFCKTHVKYDHVIDIVGNRTPKEMLRLLKPGGKCVVIGMTRLGRLFRFMFHPSKQIKVVQVEASTEILNDLGEFLSNGNVKSHITAVHELSAVPQALLKLGERHVCGKHIVKVTPD